MLAGPHAVIAWRCSHHGMLCTDRRLRLVGPPPRPARTKHKSARGDDRTGDHGLGTSRTSITGRGAGLGDPKSADRISTFPASKVCPLESGRLRSDRTARLFPAPPVLATGAETGRGKSCRRRSHQTCRRQPQRRVPGLLAADTRPPGFRLGPIQRDPMVEGTRSTRSQAKATASRTSRLSAMRGRATVGTLPSAIPIAQGEPRRRVQGSRRAIGENYPCKAPPFESVSGINRDSRSQSRVKGSLGFVKRFDLSFLFAVALLVSCTPSRNQLTPCPGPLGWIRELGDLRWRL